MTPVSHRRFKKDVVSRRTKMRGQVVGKNTTLLIIGRSRAENKGLCVTLTNCANVWRMKANDLLSKVKAALRAGSEGSPQETLQSDGAEIANRR